MLILLVLVSFAQALPVPVFRDPESRFHSGYADTSLLGKNVQDTRELVWLKILYRGRTGWVLQKDLLLAEDFSAKEKYIFTFKNAIFYSEPRVSGKVLALLNEKTKLQLIRHMDEWLYAQLGPLKGYVLREQALSGESIGAHPMRATTPPGGIHVFSQPDSRSRKLGQIRGGEVVAIQSKKNTTWKHATVSDLGPVWWLEPSLLRKTKRIETSDLFSRPIFDMVTLPPTNPSAPVSKFVSAGGIYKSSEDGWVKIEKFSDKNYPLASAKNGRLFVGPFISEDGGTTFHHYINWQNLLKTMGIKDLQNLQLQSIEVTDLEGKELLLTARSREIDHQIYSRDGGKSWTLVKSVKH